MLINDVTENTVVYITAVTIGALFVTAIPANAVSRPQLVPPSPPAMLEWKWENKTVVVKHSILVQNGEVLRIRNSTVKMDSSRGMIGIVVLGVLEVENSIIESCDSNGYFFMVRGLASIESSTIKGVRSIFPMAEGILVTTMFFQLRNSTLRSYDNHALTVFFPYLVESDYAVGSDVQGIMTVSSRVNVRNSTVGDLAFRYAFGEFNLWNCTYMSVSSTGGLGFVYSWRYIQVRTSLPEADLTITNSEGHEISVGRTDSQGYYRSWWLSQSHFVDMKRTVGFNYNPHTFEAWKTVEGEILIGGLGGGLKRVSFAQDYYGVTTQDIEENPFIEIDMRPL